ncbi:two-component system response regulator [Desulfuromonas versatilis]|uniref:Two-component system response regulator n=1 Tax=Desulfuromonas versatilis TaxID=2802975 RepID=A0ABM8HNN1_9BACT|nr:HD domain-containing phosphohydrolase [Desulfuromonas versatilis]BCR03117.1 two-component system response regulator [Desulfuromonas versatilis]
MIENHLPDAPTVLFVDDEKNILASLRRLMHREDIEALTAASGPEGLELLQASPNIGLIVSDQRMPGMNGADFLARAREIRPDVHRIMLTGYSDLSATIDAINKGGAHRFITKPWDDADLLRAIREELKSYQLVKENERLGAIIGRQNEELKDWNKKLKARVLEQTAEIREKNASLRTKNLKLQEMFRDTIEALSRLIELRAKKLRDHSGNVTRLAVDMAEARGMTPQQVEVVRVAGLLHDIGEIGIPDELLNKPLSQCDPEELEVYMQHTIRGQATIDAISILRPAGLLIRHHHENFNGSGFPDGLQGSAIPQGARILALADFVDREINREHTSSVDKTLLKARELAGTKFDPELVPLLEKPLRKHYRHDNTKQGMVRKTLPPAELRIGMVLMQNLLSGTGLLLLKEGSVLDEKSIQAIGRYQKIDPIKGAVVVMVKGE